MQMLRISIMFYHIIFQVFYSYLFFYLRERVKKKKKSRAYIILLNLLCTSVSFRNMGCLIYQSSIMFIKSLIMNFLSPTFQGLVLLFLLSIRRCDKRGTDKFWSRFLFEQNKETCTPFKIRFLQGHSSSNGNNYNKWLLHDKNFMYS